MLVLSRKSGERIRIGQDVTVTVMEIREGRVRLGIEAPRATPVHREEVWLSLQQQQERKGGE